MQTSPEINEVAAALVVAYPQFKAIVKDKWNDHFSSHYADLAAIRDAVAPGLTAAGLFILQAPTAVGAVVTVKTRILHRSGQYIEASFSAEARNGSAQSVGAAVTYLCRYALISMLGLSLGEDDDGNATRPAENREPPPRDPVAGPDPVFDFKTMEHELAAELKKRNVPDQKWEAIGRWLDGKDKKLISKAIASV